MAIIESIRDFIAGCPLLKNGVLLNVDRLGATEIEYTVDGEITSPILRQYTDGSSLRQFEFVFASREKYGADTLQNIANSGFYEDFADWIETQSNAGNLPELGKYRVPQYIEADDTRSYTCSGGSRTFQRACVKRHKRVGIYQDFTVNECLCSADFLRCYAFYSEFVFTLYHFAVTSICRTFFEP